MSQKHIFLITKLQEVNRLIHEYIAGILSHHKLPVTTMIIIREIKNEPGISISELSRRTGIAKSHISNIIRKLHEENWIEKRHDVSDHRIQQLFLSQLASEHLESARADLKLRVADLLSEIPETRTEELIKGLQEIQDLLILAKERER